MPVPASSAILNDDHSFYRWFQRPAPPLTFTLALTAVCAMRATYLYLHRVRALRQKFHSAWSHGGLRITALISAYADHYGHDAARFTTLKVWTKCLGFLAILQWRFHAGFAVMWIVLTLEATLDTARVWWVYRMATSSRRDAAGLAAAVSASQQLRISSHKHQEEETIEASSHNTATFHITNVYEDLTRPLALAMIVFIVQAILIGLVMVDTYVTTSRTCFHTQDDDDDVADVDVKVACAILNSLGSYLLYVIGALMTTVFCVGPRNIADGEKGPLNQTFWLQLFLHSKSQPKTKTILTWTDSATEELHTWTVQSFHVWIRFLMSFTVNGIGFVFLLHILPIQVSGQSTIIGVVFRAVGMIYLADLDDYGVTPTFGVTSSSVQNDDEVSSVLRHSNGSTDVAATIMTEELPSMMTAIQENHDATYGSANATNTLTIDPEQEQRIVDQAVTLVKEQVREALLRHRHRPGNSPLSTTNDNTTVTDPFTTRTTSPSHSAAPQRFSTITHALLDSTASAQKEHDGTVRDEEASPLLV